MKLLLIVLSLLSLPVLAEITINKPLLILVDATGTKVSTDSTSIEKAMEKASRLPDGVYTLQRPDVTITVLHKLINLPPVANAGPDQTVKEGDIVFLDCSLSYDPEGQPITCEWVQIVKPGDPIVEILYSPTGTAYFYKPSGADGIAHCPAPDDFYLKA